MTQSLSTNPLLELAGNFVNFTDNAVFLTGKAGTGKTTFLKQLHQNCPKQFVVLAPTGVAAINAGGATIHSFFQLPFGPFIPEHQQQQEMQATSKQALLARLRFNKEKRALLRSIDLMVIDEISMVRCDVLDAIDTVLRHFRNNSQPFGGVQMLFIGDMYQLPPVVPDQEWQILQQFYNGPFFFHSRVIQQQPPVYIELQTIYRQSNAQFIQLLNEVRNNQLTTEGLQLLNSRVNADFVPPKHTHYITLTTHNRKADAINDAALTALPGKWWKYAATVHGDFNERNYPAEATLQLKEGAQVMFLKNDATAKRYFNGKIGVVTQLDESEIFVQCPDDEKPIKVTPDTWRNVQYTLNKQLQQVEEEEVGTFTQFPLRLAWAVTIHKSQGLTFDHAIIDAATSFSAGQVYVALSRCKSLEGMVLLSKVPASAVRVDKQVQQFAGTAPHSMELDEVFAASRSRFQQQLLLKAFDAGFLVQASQALQQILKQHPDSYGPQAAGWVAQFAAQCQHLSETAAKFQQQLQVHFAAATGLLELDEWINDRVKKAALWFSAQLAVVLDQIKQQPAVTDSQELAEEFEESLGQALTAARQWQKYQEACSEGFDTTRLLRAKSIINISEVVGQAHTSSKRSTKTEQSPHPALLQQLQQLRDSICTRERKPIYMVAGTATLHQAAMYLPQTPEQLLQISGFGTQKVAQYGQQFLDIINEYCTAHQLESQIHNIAHKRQRKVKNETKDKEPKIDTRALSLQLWQQGKTIADIAAERNLKPVTIEGHLVPYILEGIVPMSVIISPSLFEKAANIMRELATSQMGPVKEILGDEISFGQIKLVQQWLQQHEQWLKE